MLEIWDAIGYQYKTIAGEPLRTIYEDLQVNDSLTLEPYDSQYHKLPYDAKI